MIVTLIVVRNEDVFWTAGAWDEYTVDENPEGFEEALRAARNSNGVNNVRTLEVWLPEGSLAKAFEATKVYGEVRG